MRCWINDCLAVLYIRLRTDLRQISRLSALQLCILYLSGGIQIGREQESSATGGVTSFEVAT